LNQDIFFTQAVDEKELEQESNRILSDARLIHLKNISEYGIVLSLFGIYVDKNVMFYRLRLQNRTNIDYDVESLRFYVVDQRKAKRTASQEITMQPLHVSSPVSAITAQSEINTVFTLEKFTIPDAKRLIIEILEKHGGRHLKLSIKNRTIVSAQPIPE